MPEENRQNYAKKCPECGEAKPGQWVMDCKVSAVYAVSEVDENGRVYSTDLIEETDRETMHYECMECGHYINVPGWGRDCEFDNLEVVKID